MCFCYRSFSLLTVNNYFCLSIGIARRPVECLGRVSRLKSARTSLERTHIASPVLERRFNTNKASVGGTLS